MHFRRFSKLLLLAFLCGAPLSSVAQRAFIQSPFQGFTESPYGILNNSVANLHTDGGRVWVGPFLNSSSDLGATWYLPDSDSLFGTVNRLFSLDIDGNVIVAGIGRSDQTGGQSIQTASGFLVSEDGGSSFSYRFPQLDGPEDDTEVYGVSVLPALPVIVPQQSPPFDVDYDPVTQQMWVAGWASGIRRSADMGRTWMRVVLPPDNLDVISPENPYTFSVEPQRGGTGSLNHMGFSVLVDGSGTIWAGTAGGLNRSTNGGTAWRKFRTDFSGKSLTGNWIISLEEQPLTSPPTIWAASWNTGESGGAAGQYGVTVVRNGGEDFSQTLLGEKVYDFAFDSGTVYVAGDNGLFISNDEGRTWNSVSQFRDATSGRIVRPQSSVFSVEVDDRALWVGTSDGLLRSLDGGSTWTIFHVDVPLHPAEASASVPDVNSFAYPNPFSRGDDSFVRIKFDAAGDGTATIRIFDFGMNLVRSITTSVSAGTNESMWDGLNSGGATVPNGPYFYDVEVGNKRHRGKILVIE